MDELSPQLKKHITIQLQAEHIKDIVTAYAGAPVPHRSADDIKTLLISLYELTEDNQY